MSFLSYAQNFEDVMLWRALKSVPNGFYIDVGASHPDHESVTRALYDRGWHGINIEPDGADFRRLEAARLRDINLNVALGKTPGMATFYTVPGTGLSTLETSALPAITAGGFEIQSIEIEVQTLAEVCRRHAPDVIHFLKVDVEGGERAVLAGADFTTWRPWIVLVEATAPMSTIETHAEWDFLLTMANYHVVWFDGLNRYYVADEQKTSLAPFFQTPPNVFDDFMRVSDNALAAERTASCAVAEKRLAMAEHRLDTALTRSALALEQRRDAIEASLLQAAELTRLHAQVEGLRHVAAEAAQLRALLSATHTSTSWRLTAPLRLASRLLRPRPLSAAPMALPPTPAPAPAPAPMLQGAPETKLTAPAAPPRIALIRTVHQFHAGSAVGDAITNAMLLTRELLRSFGYVSDIFVAHRDPALSHELRTIDELPQHGDYILLVRHSMGFDAFDQIASLKAVKILHYHNITPPEFFEGNPGQQAYCRLGRAQLLALKPLVAAALADSEYNAIELRSLGFQSVQACTMLFDLAALRRRVQPHLQGERFTIIFVGRVVEAKGQLELIKAYRHFRTLFKAPSRLILIGGCDYESDYLSHLETEALAPDLRSHVIMTGLISDAERDAYYATADLYVSLSRHEGFGVPLVEAMANGVPILAWPGAAVPYTLGGAGELLRDATSVSVAEHMFVVAQDPARRARIIQAQYRSLERFALAAQTPILLRTLARAGACTPPDPAALAMLKANMRFEINGHMTTSYSLALVNRTLALTLDEARPGRVRVVPAADEAGVLETGLPAPVRARLLALAARNKPHTGPVVVISHQYPLFVPPSRGDVLLALFFWEESLVPAATIAQLNSAFMGVLAPSRFVAKVLVDSGLSIPVFNLRFAPDLSAFAAIRGGAPTGEVFTFLHVSSCFPRKGVDALLAAYAASFCATDKVRLVIKGFPNPHNDVEAQIATLRSRDHDLAEIILIDRDMDEAELVSLYAQADAVVLPTRGEGLNLPAVEALAAGIPVIITGHGGQMDFCNTDDVRLLDYQFAHAGSHMATSNSLWVNPQISDLSAALREAFARGRRAAVGVNHPGPAIGATDEIDKLEEFALHTLVTPLPAASIAWISSWGIACGIAGYSNHLISHLPPSERINRITILADYRTKAAKGEREVLPSWRTGDPESLPHLMAALTRLDPDVTVIQHHPGLMSWTMLTDLLTMLALRGRIVTVTLHNTKRIFDLAPDAQAELVLALGKAARVIVHTVLDVNWMKSLSLVDNVVMIPHGASTPGPAKPIRHLAASGNALIGCYGFFLPDKGLPQLIESFAILRRTWPNLRLRLVNADYGTADSRDEIAACRQMARDTGLADAIEFCTQFLPNDDSLALLEDCDIVVLAHQGSTEGASGSGHTVLAAGVPVMVTPLPVFDALGSAVLRFDSTAPVDMAAGISSLLINSVQREALQEAGRAWTEARSWSSIATRTQGLILGLALQR